MVSNVVIASALALAKEKRVGVWGTMLDSCCTFGSKNRIFYETRMFFFAFGDEGILAFWG